MATHDGPRRADGAASTAAARSEPIPAATLIGEVAVLGADGRARRVGGRQPQLVLAYLLLEDRTVSREELAELLWGEEIPTHWAGAVRGVLSKVRNALAGSGIGADALVVEGGTVRLAPAPGATTDVALAADAVEVAAARLEDGGADDAIALARGAGRRLAGPFLIDGDGDWVRRQQERVADLVRRAASVEIEALLRSGRPELAAERAAARVAEDVFDERAHHLRIEALLAAGRSSSAVHAYELLAEVLRAELGIAPAAATTELVTAVPAAGAAVVDLRDPEPQPRSSGGGGGGGGDAAPSGRRAAWMAPSGRFVGRSGELARLEVRWAEVVRDGNIQAE
jgi:DNA-binding SARP family transcriptional activator